ncbi:hypothetical protein KEM52_005274 [Ascosphaera acerosa]|nr:hypothetical protein KEM52_005274 [Ascosphaera acerosa]
MAAQSPEGRRSRSASFDSLFDEDGESESSRMDIDTAASSNARTGPIRTKDLTARRQEQQQQRRALPTPRASSSDPASASGSSSESPPPSRPPSATAAGSAPKPVWRNDKYMYIIQGRPRFKPWSDERVLQIFDTYETYKSGITPPSWDEEATLMRFQSDLDRLRLTDPSDRPSIRERLLDRETGLYMLRDDEDLPDWVRDDVTAILKRWRIGDFDPYLLRGVEVRRGVEHGRLSRGEIERYRFKRPANKVGANGLVNGQWWPFQIAMVRDGAHGSTEGGISGNADVGALSCIIGGGIAERSGKDYKDRDLGNVVEYCSTPGDKHGKMTAHTRLMLQAHARKTPIRVFRSERARTQLAPSRGLRYDGLYQICDYTELDSATQWYRFTLERLPGQPPIRCKGPEARPTKWDVIHLDGCLAQEQKGVTLLRRLPPMRLPQRPAQARAVRRR